MLEIRFESGVAYKNPFREVLLDGVFTSPSGKEVKVPGFWAGDRAWKLRFSSAEPGVHSYRTRCSDSGNSGLHEQWGEVRVTPYTGTNPLYRHGPLRISRDKRHFCYADGTPFFWMGDTWWMGLCQRLGWPEDFQRLAQNRKERGFNVIQLVAGFYPDMPLFDDRGLSTSGFCWEQDLSQVNPQFFDEADQKIVYLVEAGLMPCIVGAWGYYLPLVGPRNMKLHWRYVMARWAALPVVLVAAGEQTLPWYLESPAQKLMSAQQQMRGWSDVMAHMRALNGFGRLVTTHPVISARASVTHDALLDFDMQQTGHGLPTAHHAARARQGWRGQPAMPVISAESRYEALEVNPTVTARDVREAFWAHTLSSGVAGHTYGANGIWQVNTPQNPFGPSPSGSCWGNLPWEDAIQLPAASQVGMGRAFLETLPWFDMAPQGIRHASLGDILGAWPRLQRLAGLLGLQQPLAHPVAMAASRQHATYLIYTIALRPFDVSLLALRQTLAARWVDPTDFASLPAVVHVKGRQLHAKPPGLNAAGDDDWLLLLRPLQSLMDQCHPITESRV